jgi:hypothetical protein
VHPGGKLPPGVLFVDELKVPTQFLQQPRNSTRVPLHRDVLEVISVANDSDVRSHVHDVGLACQSVRTGRRWSFGAGDGALRR